MEEGSAGFLALALIGCTFWITHTISARADEIKTEITEMDADVANTNANLVNIDDELRRIREHD